MHVFTRKLGQTSVEHVHIERHKYDNTLLVSLVAANAVRTSGETASPSVTIRQEYTDCIQSKIIV